jgi:hypothetical protein
MFSKVTLKGKDSDFHMDARYWQAVLAQLAKKPPEQPLPRR